MDLPVSSSAYSRGSLGFASRCRSCHSTLAHRPVSSALAPSSLGSTWEHRSYGSTGLPRSSGSTLVRRHSSSLHPLPSLRLNLGPRSHRLHFGQSSLWLCLSLQDHQCPLVSLRLCLGLHAQQPQLCPSFPWCQLPISTMAPPSIDFAVGLHPGCGLGPPQLDCYDARTRNVFFWFFTPCEHHYFF